MELYFFHNDSDRQCTGLVTVIVFTVTSRDRSNTYSCMHYDLILQYSNMC